MRGPTWICRLIGDVGKGEADQFDRRWAGLRHKGPARTGIPARGLAPSHREYRIDKDFRARCCGDIRRNPNTGHCFYRCATTYTRLGFELRARPPPFSRGPTSFSSRSQLGILLPASQLLPRNPSHFLHGNQEIPAVKLFRSVSSFIHSFIQLACMLAPPTSVAH